MAAGLVESIIKNHPFIDGNKRAAHLAVGMFLSLNDYFLNMDEASVIEITQGVATGDVNIDKLELWISKNVRSKNYRIEEYPLGKGSPFARDRYLID